MNPVGWRKRQRIRRANEHVYRPISQQHARDCAECGDNKTFRQHLAHNSPTGGPKRTANRQFLCSQGGTTKLHIHHVHTCDQQNEDDGGKHSPNLLAQLRAGHCLQKRLDACGGERAVRFRIVLRQTARQPDKLRIHLVDADARFEPAHYRGGGIIGTNDQLAARCRRILIVKGNPELIGKRKFKIRRHYTDDGRSLAINPNALSDDVGVAIEIPLPNLVT